MVLSCASTSYGKIPDSTQAQLQHQVRLAPTDIDSLIKLANEPKMVLSCASTSYEKIPDSTQAQLQHQVRLAPTDIDSLIKLANEPNDPAQQPGPLGEL
jgi:hypothetical protein